MPLLCSSALHFLSLSLSSTLDSVDHILLTALCVIYTAYVASPDYVVPRDSDTILLYILSPDLEGPSRADIT